VIDISHESLMRNWDRLGNWVTEETQSALIYKRLAETATMHDQGTAGYWRDPELTIGLTWRNEQQPNPTWAKRYAPNFDEALAFLAASAEAAEAEATEKERARKREVNRLRGFLALLGGLSVLTGGAAVYAFNQQQEAKTQTAVAEEQRSVAEEQTAAAKTQEKIALDEKARADNQRKLAVEAQKEAEAQKQQAETAQAAETEQRQVAETALQRAETGESEANRQAQIAQQQTTIADKNADQARQATQRAEVQTQRAEVQTLNTEIQAEALTAENLMATGLNFKALLNGLDLGQRIGQIESRSGVGTAVATKSQVKATGQGLTPASSPIRASTRLQAVSVLREAVYLGGWREKNTMRGHTGGLSGLSFSPDGQTIASASADGTAKLWDLSGNLIQTLAGHSDPVQQVVFSPSGELLASASADGTVRLWDRAGKEQ
jgi:hypothetical protein